MQALRRVSALLILLLMVGTLLCRFILPPIEDAREREKYGMPDARVTDTARTPYLCASEDGVATFFADVGGHLETLVVPEIVNGVAVKTLSLGRTSGKPQNVKTLILPRTCEPVSGYHLTIESWAALQTVVIPEGVTDTSTLRLKENKSLTAVYMPRSMEKVYKNLLEKQGEGTVLHYAGSEEEWLSLGTAAKHIAETRTVVYHSVYQGEP